MDVVAECRTLIACVTHTDSDKGKHSNLLEAAVDKVCVHRIQVRENKTNFTREVIAIMNAVRPEIELPLQSVEGKLAGGILWPVGRTGNDAMPGLVDRGCNAHVQMRAEIIVHNRAYFEIGITHPRKICHQLIKKFNVRVSGCPSYGAEVKIHAALMTVKDCNQRKFHTVTVHTRLSHSVDGKTLTVFRTTSCSRPIPASSISMRRVRGVPKMPAG